MVKPNQNRINMQILLSKSIWPGPRLRRENRTNEEKIESEEIDIWMFSSNDRKWDSLTNTIMINKMKRINPKVEVITSDSEYQTISSKNWMPEGTSSITFGKQSNLINKEESYKDPKG